MINSNKANYQNDKHYQKPNTRINNLTQNAVGTAIAVPTVNTIRDIIQSVIINNTTNTAYSIKDVIDVNTAKTHAKKMLEDNGLNYKTSKDKVKNKGIVVDFCDKSSRYIQELKEIIVNKKHPMDVFHETGHAISNHNKSGILYKFIRNHKGLVRASILSLLLIAGLNQKQNKEEEKNAGPIKKGANFIHNNIGALIFTPYIPQLTEELVASKNGLKYLNKTVLPKELKSNFKKRMALCYSTYLTSAVIFAASGQASITLKDFIVSKMQSSPKFNNVKTKQKETTSRISQLKSVFDSKTNIN